MGGTPRTAQLICGPTAAGKSTYAVQLATELNGVRLSVDEWMHTMFSAILPEQIDMASVLPRVGRCQAQVWSVANQILATGTSVVLGLGLLRGSNRVPFK